MSVFGREVDAKGSHHPCTLVAKTGNLGDMRIRTEVIDARLAFAWFRGWAAHSS